MTWQPDTSIRYCPECRHGIQAHYDWEGHLLPAGCCGAKDRWGNPRLGKLDGPGCNRGDCGCMAEIALAKPP